MWNRQSLAPASFESIVKRVGIRQGKQRVAERQQLVTDVLAQYTRTMALAKHRCAKERDFTHKKAL